MARDALAAAIDADGDAKAGRAILAKLAAELERRGIEPDEIGRLARISLWQTVTKDKAGEAHHHDLYGFQLAPTWDAGPEWPVVQPGPTVKVAGRRPAARPPADVAVTVILPDMQIGYFRNRDGGLEPIHDTSAIDVALELLAVIRPQQVVLLGDNLDLPEMSRYRLSPAFRDTTQAAIDYATELVARIRATVGDGVPIVWLAGNHEERLPNWIVDNARAAFGLRQGGRPDSWPVLSVPHLCRLDEVDVEYRPGYSASDVWLTSNLRVIHGDRVRSKGSTAHLYLDQSKTSVVYGHIHRIERAHRTRRDFDGPAEIMAASPGCLARIDGVVPSTKQGLDLDGRPIPTTEDWQQGLAVVTVDGDLFDYEQVRIAEGRAWWRGCRYGAAA